MREPLAPLSSLIRSYLEEVGDELTARQRELLKTVDEGSRRLLAVLDELPLVPDTRDTARTTDSLARTRQGPAVYALGTQDPLAHTVARLLISDDAVAPLRDLLRGAAGRSSDPLPATAVMPCDLRARTRRSTGGMRRELGTLLDTARSLPSVWERYGEVLPSLIQAAQEQAAGVLSPVRSSQAGAPGGGQSDVLLRLRVPAVEPWPGSPRALPDEVLMRAVATRMHEDDRALRWPRDGFLVLLRRVSDRRAQRFSEGVIQEWQARLSGPLASPVPSILSTARVVRVGDLAGTVTGLLTEEGYLTRPAA